MFRRVKRYIYKRIMCLLNPVKYYRKIGVKIGQGTKIYSKETDMFSSEPWVVSIGDNCHITAGCRFLTHDGGILIFDKTQMDGFVLVGDITVGNNVYFGIRTIVMPGVNIGDNVIIGAGSIITKDIPSGSVVAGVPARVIKSTEEYLSKILDAKKGNNPRFYHDLDYMHSLNPRKK